MSRVALINMPWSSVNYGSIALGILKRVLRRNKIPADVFNLNMNFARRMDLRIYESVSQNALIGEWLFSQHLFGRFGSGELRNCQSDLTRGRNIKSSLKSLFEGMDKEVEATCRQAIPEFLEECLSSVPWEKYSLVGFTSVFSQHVSSLLLAKKLKALYPHIKTVFGGANLQGPMGPATLKSFDWVDYVVDGEAEAVFPVLARNILDEKFDERLPGVSFRIDDAVVAHGGLSPMIHMDTVPVPDYTEYFRQIRSNGLAEQVRPKVLFESSRGCWWGEKAHCTFCGLNGQYMKYRSKSADRILRELKTQTRRYGTLSLEAVDNILDMDAFSSLLPKLADEKLDVDLFYEIKSSLNREQMDMLHAVGVTHVQPGIESLSTEVLKLMRKGVSAIQNVQILKWCQEKRMQVSWNILYGFPGEKKEHYDKTSRTVTLISHLHPPMSVLRIILQRFSPYHFDAERLGIRNVRPASLYYHIYPESTVDLNNLAFYFDHSLDSQYEKPENYIGPVMALVSRWQEAFRKKKIHFYYRHGPGFLEIKDNRPLEPDKEIGPTRKTLLKGIAADVYLFCDSIRGFKSVHEYVREKARVDYSQEELREMLDGMTGDGLMMKENDRYLSLALPYSSR